MGRRRIDLCPKTARKKPDGEEPRPYPKSKNTRRRVWRPVFEHYPRTNDRQTNILSGQWRTFTNGRTIVDGQLYCLDDFRRNLAALVFFFFFEKLSMKMVTPGFNFPCGKYTRVHAVVSRRTIANSRG